MGKIKQHEDTIHLRLPSDLKARIEAIAKRKHISSAGFVRMALGEYLDAHETRLFEQSATGYTAPPQTSPEPPVKLRNAIAPLRIPTTFYVVKRAPLRRA